MSLRVAYIATGYPYVSHTFIQNEVDALRRLGVDVKTFAVRRSTPEQILSEAHREAFATTYAIRPPRISHLVKAHIRGLTSAPSRYWETLRLAYGMRTAGSRSLLWQIFYFVQAVLLWDRCRRAGVRHVHAHFANVASDLALLAASVGGPGWSWSFTMHGPTEFYDISRFRLATKVERADFVVCISQFARSQLMAFIDPGRWAKLHVVACGVDLEVVAADRVAKESDAQAHPHVLCVGRLVPVKGQALLLEAVQELERKGRPLRLTFVGDGPDHDSLRLRAADLGLTRVRFTGALGHDEVLGLMRQADVFCLPSFAEGVPIVLMEAMALGLPVISTRVMGIPELVEQGASGVLVAPGDGEGLTAALESLLGDPALRLALGRRARERIEAAYQVGASAGRLRALFAEQSRST